MARKLGDTGQAAVLDGGQIKRLIKISQTTNHAQRDQTVVVLSYWLGLRAKELASLKVSDVYLPGGEILQVLHYLGYPVTAREGIPKLWASLKNWLSNSKEINLVVPDPGHYVHIGSTLRLAFPTWRDLRSIRTAISGMQPT